MCHSICPRACPKMGGTSFADHSTDPLAAQANAMVREAMAVRRTVRTQRARQQVRQAQQSRTGTPRGGQAVVEFALILPVFVLLVFGALEFGRAYYNIHLLTNAAREGARRGSLPGQLETDVEDTVDTFLEGCGLSGDWTSSVAVTAPDGTTRSGLSAAQEGDTVEVTVEYDFTVVTGQLLPGVSDTIALRGRCAFRHE